jgi:dual specificity phosphatase 12
MNRIIPNLYLGGVSAAFDERTYRDYKVTHVLSIMQRQVYFVRKMTLTRKKFDVSHRLVNVRDRPDAFLMKYWPKCFDFIDAALRGGGVVLVHCMAGVSRSAATVAAYLLYKNQFSSVNEALRHVQSKRRDVNPNPGFVRQLEFFYAMGCTIPQELTRAMKRRSRKAFEVDDFAAAGEGGDEEEMGRNVILRVIVNVFFCLFIAHFTCSISNLYTTQLYIDLATNNETRNQYATALHDTLFQFQPTVMDICLTHLERVSDVALWIIGLRLIYCLSQTGRCIEEVACAFTLHSLFMALVQIGTTLPSSGGLEECMSYNELDKYGQLIWPSYGVSFITQSFAGARACADMLYSGHTSVCLIFTMFTHIGGNLADTYWRSALLSTLLVCTAVFPLVICHGHYTADVVLAVGIAPLLCTSKMTLSIARSIRNFLS